MAFGLAAYVSPVDYPTLAQGSLPGAGQALLDGLLPAGFLQKVSDSHHGHPPPFPSFLAQTVWLKVLELQAKLLSILADFPQNLYIGYHASHDCINCHSFRRGHPAAKVSQ